MKETRNLDQDEFIRRRLFSGQKSAFRRYSELVIGEVSLWRLIRYELIISFLGVVPGAIGLVLRKTFYPLVFGKVGKGVIFGKSLTIRHPAKIHLGNRVVIDDYAVLDARGTGEDALEIGDEVIVNRGVTVLAKSGPLQIGSYSDIGSQSVLIAQGGTFIGEMVTIGGGCKIGGGAVEMDPTSAAESGSDDPNDFAARGQTRFTRGAVRIGDKTIFGRGVMVLDGVTIGEQCLIGSGTVVRNQIPDHMTVIPKQDSMTVPRTIFSRQQEDSDTSTAGTRAGQVMPLEEPQAPSQSAAGPQSATGKSGGKDSESAVLAFRAIDEVNAQLPPESRIARSPESPLLQPDGPLDSLGLINLVVATEETFRRQSGRTISLSSYIDADPGNAFRTVGSLIELIESVSRGEV